MDLVLHLEQKYFDQIKRGEKTEEYRQATEYWNKRIYGKTFDNIILQCGYPKKNDHGKTIVRKWNGYTLKKIDVPLYGGEVLVYAIDVTLQ